MRKLQKLNIEYVGYKEPENEEELNMELLGLENAIKNAELRISMLRQGLHLNKMMKNALAAGDKLNEQTVDKTSAEVKENQQEAK